MITLKNGKQLETTAVYGGTATYQSANRKTLELVIPADTLTLDEAKAIWQDSDATSEITVEDSGEISVHLNYTLPMTLSMDTIDGVQTVHIKLAQKSALELMQEKQTQDMDDVNAALCELAEIVAGGEDNG